MLVALAVVLRGQPRPATGVFVAAPSATSSAVVVNWLEPLGYTKPVGLAVTMPDEASAVNKYWVNLSGGSGTTCTSGTPCSWDTIAGKAGTTGSGGGAYIYLQGSGGLSDIVLNGTLGNEIVIKPRDDSTTATITGRSNWAAIKHYVIFDGGPNMQIRFNNTTGGTFDPSIMIHETATATAIQNLTFYRTRWHVTGLGTQFAAWGAWTNLSFINSEFDALGASDTTNQHHMYISQNGVGTPGNGTTGAGLYIKNNIFRDSPGELIEFRMSGTASNINGGEITGNAFHDGGIGTCANSSWHCRGAISIAEGPVTNMLIANNLMWDLGEGCMRPWSTDTSDLIYNNTCYNWGYLGPTDSNGFSGSFPAYAFAGITLSVYQATFRNNILYATGSYNGFGKSAFPAGGTAPRTFNACVSGQNCGTSNQAISAASFLSLNENNIDFLKPTSTATTKNTGTAVCASTTDYFGNARPIGGTCDIGALEQ